MEIKQPERRAYAAIQADWAVSLDRFESPLDLKSDEQMLIFGDEISDLVIASEIIPLEGAPLPGGGTPKVGLLVFRYLDPERYYFAGVGAFGAKFVIGKQAPGGPAITLASAGDSGWLNYGTVYSVRVECVASRITLLINNVPALVADDETYRSGRWGLRTWRTRVRFGQTRALPAPVLKAGHFNDRGQKIQPRLSPTVLNRASLSLLYLFGTGSAAAAYRFPDARSSVVAILATGSIFATFGSAIMTLFGVMNVDSGARAEQDLAILHSEILHDPNPWRRWPFLKRRSARRLYGGDVVRGTLSNPEMAFDVGSHVLTVDLPSVVQDFFDLSVLRNYAKLLWFHRAFHSRLNREAGERQGGSPGLVAELTRYECVLDVWASVFWFRVARFGVHLGAAVIFGGVFAVVYQLVTFREATQTAASAAVAGDKGSGGGDRGAPPNSVRN